MITAVQEAYATLEQDRNYKRNVMVDRTIPTDTRSLRVPQLHGVQYERHHQHDRRSARGRLGSHLYTSWQPHRYSEYQNHRHAKIRHVFSQCEAPAYWYGYPRFGTRIRIGIRIGCNFCFVTDQDRSALSAESEVGVMYDVWVTTHVAPSISGSAGIRRMFAKCTAYHNFSVYTQEQFNLG